ncbi:transcriptional regulator [Klebsiella oxytoca]|nr:transcriptional regulator [Klebsiella oxytoca]
MSAKKVTMKDIARDARVGIATVDRVLNKRTPVKESTERKVLESARRLGFALETIAVSAGSRSVRRSR